MESVRCYLCDHEFVEGEEPWLMFEQRLTEDGAIECPLADLLASILQEQLVESTAHSSLLCDSCNADLLEYESLEKRFTQLKERILSSYKENITILGQAATPLVVQTKRIIRMNIDGEGDEVIIHDVPEEHDKGEGLYFVEEVQEDCAVDVQETEQAPVSIKTEDKMNDSFDFAAFDEHVAQTSLPHTSLLNLSDGLVNLAATDSAIDVQNIPYDNQDIIIYDVAPNQLLQKELIVDDLHSSSNELQAFREKNDDDYDFIISSEAFNDVSLQGGSPADENAVLMGEASGYDDDDDDLEVDDDQCSRPLGKQDEVDYFCLQCDILPACSRESLEDHMRTVHDSELYLCKQCHVGFSDQQDLKDHLGVSHSIKCTMCQRVFNNNRLHRIHKRIHSGNSKPFECLVCQKRYSSKGMLEEHMNTHTGVRPFKCNECPKDFASKYTLLAHMKIHKERPRPYRCDLCGRDFLNQQNLTQHKKLHVSVRAFTCGICYKNFATQHSLQVHQIVHSGQRPFICRICGKSFARRPEIQDHERTHTGEKPFKCDICGLAFAQRSNLSSHKKSTHLNEKLHKCEQCLRSFKRRRLLDYHIRSAHTGERPHKCEICGAGFVYPEHFKKHMLIHSGKKPFACEVCGKQFNSRDNRNAHRFIHSDKKPYECMECGAGFMRKPLLLTHMKQTKHVNDTIIVNQPQFSHLTAEGESISLDSNSLEHEEVDNDLQVDTSEEAIFRSDDFLSDQHSETIENEVGADVITAVDGQLIKDELGVVKYLQFEDLERDGHQTLTWVDIGSHNKL